MEKWIIDNKNIWCGFSVKKNIFGLGVQLMIDTSNWKDGLGIDIKFDCQLIFFNFWFFLDIPATPNYRSTCKRK